MNPTESTFADNTRPRSAERFRIRSVSSIESEVLDATSVHRHGPKRLPRTAAPDPLTTTTPFSVERATGSGPFRPVENRFVSVGVSRPRAYLNTIPKLISNSIPNPILNPIPNLILNLKVVADPMLATILQTLVQIEWKIVARIASVTGAIVDPPDFRSDSDNRPRNALPLCALSTYSDRP